MDKMFKVNQGNTKLGKSILAINLPAISTCRQDAPCKGVCYANKGCFKYKNVKECYANNLEVFLTDPIKAQHDILSQLPYMGFVRLHASGDFVNYTYLDMIVDICNKLPNVQFMAYTKKYEMFNKYVEEIGMLPDNLKIIFSQWDGFEMDNRHNFPVAQVRLKAGNVDPIQQDAFECSGNCSQCYKCWMMEEGQTVVFNQH